MNKNHFSFYVAALALLLGMLPQRLLADGVTQAQFDAAYDAITASANKDSEGKLWYRIFTRCVDGETKEMGTDRYYLTSGGTLTYDEAEAGVFQLSQVPNETTGFSSIYSEEVEKAFYVKSLSSYFTNANKAVGDRIRTAGNCRATYEAQVFFLNEDGYYAIRSTNAFVGTWWEGAWWTIGNEGVACYTQPDASDDEVTNAAFIWELEVAEANDLVTIDVSKTYGLTFTQLKAGSMYKYLLSPSYYEEEGHTDSLLHRTNMRSKQMKVKLTAADKKNAYYLQDVVSNLYIKPSKTADNGDLWSISETPEAVILGMTGTEDTYTLAGETGGLANPWGNDSSPYNVGNWKGSNFILFTAMDDTDGPAYAANIKPAYDALTAEDMKSEDGEYWYIISTTSEDGQTLGETRYYLTSSGTLSDKASEAARLRFTPVGEEADGLYTMAFKVKNGSVYFTNANKEEGESLRFNSRESTTYEAQVFCLKDGKYAIRSTNAAPGDWWEQSWWTVSSQGICCYSTPSDAAAAYIWDIEKADMSGTKVRFDSRVSYTVASANNNAYKYIQSASFNEENDNVVRRTNDPEKSIRAVMTPVEDKVNAFEMQDMISGKYIVPASDNANGSAWYYSDSPAMIIFDEIQAGRFTLRSESGNYANDYGGDNENEGLKVGNYTAGAWNFTVIRPEDFQLEEEERLQIDDANITIGENTYFRIFTTVIGESEPGDTKYYITAEGTLTSAEEEAGVFKMVPAGATTEGLSDMAYFVKNGANFFTNPNRIEGESLRTVTTDRKTYDAQLFFMNDDGMFAVRATNAFMGSYWEDSWWSTAATVDGTPVACYTKPGTDNIKFIWQLEEAAADDDLMFDAEAQYTITFDRAGVEHKFIQSLKYNETGDVTIRRTTDGEQAVRLTITAVEGKKNTFVMKDTETGHCLTPSADTANGTDWTYSEYGEVCLEKVRDNIYLMGGENGSWANAFGDDNEKEGYRVAHYSTGSQWIITVAGSEDDPVNVNDIEMSGETAPSAPIFNALGQRVKSAGNGIYIIGRRKVINNK